MPENAPIDGVLPASVTRGASQRDFGVYIHVPYCRVRCGYCDFNTYTATELGTAKREYYADDVILEMDLADRVIAECGLPQRAVSTVFFGGGTPTLLPAQQLVEMLDGVRSRWGILPDAEITTEANPDSVDEDYLSTLAAGGFTRVSIGMQSAVPHVLRTLDRTHNPEVIPDVVRAAKRAGLQTSLDLIYGTPGETLEDWRHSLETALAQEPDHLSAYALIVESGTQLARQIRRGEVDEPDDDLHAAMYELADDVLSAHGMGWYEISNWSTSIATRSRHNLAYWTGQDWWAFGPGAHSHIGGVRWWNVKHPAAYAQRLLAGRSPAQGREILSPADIRMERLMLRTRIADGLPVSELDEPGALALTQLIRDGLVDGRAAERGRVVPTRQGRLLADTIVHRLLGSV